MSTALAEESGTAARELSAKYLTFVLHGEEYGLEILKVREIIGVMEITGVPEAPSYVKGVINLRGKIIPVVDLRLKFGMPELDHTKETCIIVVSVLETLVGIVVDTVSEVLDLDREQIEEAPEILGGNGNASILGMAKVEESVKTLLDIEAVLGARDILSLQA